MNEEKTGLDRRSFLTLVGCGTCAMMVQASTGCTIAEVFDLGAGELMFDVGEPKFAALATPNNTVSVDIAGRPVILIHTENEGIVALNRLCTHVQCDMSESQSGFWNAADQQLVCTCHDSYFAPDGTKLKGPATADLTTYPVTYDEASGQGRVVVGNVPEPEIEDPTPEEFRDMVNPFEPNEDVLAEGKTLWETQCSGCHGMLGEGADFAEPNPTAFNGNNDVYSDGYLFWRIRTGGATGPENSIMPAYAEADLSDEQLWQVVTYLRSLGQ